MHPLDYLETMSGPEASGSDETMRMRPLSLAIAYVPPQAFTDLYEPEVGHSRGTLFKRLDLPFLGRAVDA